MPYFDDRRPCRLLDKELREQADRGAVAAAVSALAGVSEGDAEALQKAFNVKTVGDLGRNKYFRAAHALWLLSGVGAK